MHFWFFYPLFLPTLLQNVVDYLFVEIPTEWQTMVAWIVLRFSITKFTEIGWNDCVFERTEEHQRCSVKPSIIWDSFGMTNGGVMNSVAIFYHKVHGDRVKWLCFWAHWGTSEMFCETLYYLRFLGNDKVASTPLSHRASWTSFADLQSVLSHRERWWRLWRLWKILFPEPSFDSAQDDNGGIFRFYEKDGT